MNIRIADFPFEGSSVSPAHMRRSENHPEKDVVYIGRYHCNSSMKSIGGTTPAENYLRSEFRTNIHNLGTDIYQMDFAMRLTIWLLYLVEFANFNSQTAIGRGNGNDRSIENMGYTDDMPYHTGTMLSSRNTYGCSTQYRNIEGLWDNVCDWVDGCYHDNFGLNIILNPDDFSDVKNGISIGVPAGGRPTAFNVNSKAGFPLFYPSAVGGSDSTYSCDVWSFSNMHRSLLCGGCYE